jgi:hypothetical protein
MGSPSAFISYSWDDADHKNWVRDLSARLRADGVEVILDQWHTVPGDQLPEFMESAVRDNDYVLIVCTPRYKERSDKRLGGVGYEGDVITGEVITTRNQRKFIPILRSGNWEEAAPSWLLGKRYVDLSGSPYSQQEYQDLLITILGTRQGPPPVAQVSDSLTAKLPWEDARRSPDRVGTRLAELSLDDEERQDFGESKFTAHVARVDFRYVIIAAIPIGTVASRPTNVLRKAARMLDDGNWYNTTAPQFPPRYWPKKIFRVPRTRRSAGNALFWEDPALGGASVRSRLAITDKAEVVFVSSAGAHYVRRLDDGTGVFMLGRIVADCWELSGLVAQLYSDIGHAGQTYLCAALVGTKGTVLGGFADGYREPIEEQRWLWQHLDERDWRCHAPNVRYCDSVDVLAMEPKELPRFVYDIADAISLAYNHESPLCFDKESGSIPDCYL